MKWSIPAKTFLVGEYAATKGAPAIVLTTSPSFELYLSTCTNEEMYFHPASPAGRWWKEHGSTDYILKCNDPYFGCGGLGASSAHFIGAYFATVSLKGQPVFLDALLEAYLAYAWSGQGIPPSGYDIMAQVGSGCVYIHKEAAIMEKMAWPFPDLAFLLLHTGQKLATHDHLNQCAVLPSVASLAEIVQEAKCAFDAADSQRLIDAINAYHQRLAAMGLVANHSLQHIALFKDNKNVLAIKGCGAMGADILLIIVAKEKEKTLYDELLALDFSILATSTAMYKGPSLIL